VQLARGSSLLHRLARDGFLILAAVFVLLRVLQVQPWDRAIDALAYWRTRDGSMHGGSIAGTLGAYLHSPAFAQVLAPIVALPWGIFLGASTALLLAAYGWTGQLAAPPLLLFLPIPADIATGNVRLLYAVALAAWLPAALPRAARVTGAAGATP
jgi:hypothetical protein